MIRTGHVARTTAETDIDLTLCLEGSGKTSVATGFGLLDHMLTLTAFWAGFDLSLTCKGDTHIDAHHSAEDIALCLGQAFALAVGDRKGIARVGFARVPMDEALAEVTLDISGRPWLEWRGDELLPPVLAGEERDVWREFYVNDAGNQIEKFGVSLEARYLQIFRGEDAVPFPEDCYQGADIRVLAQKFADVHGNVYMEKPFEELQKDIAAFALPLNVQGLKDDMAKYRVHYDVWFSETTLHESGAIREMLDKLAERGATYEKDGAIWYRSMQYAEKYGGNKVTRKGLDGEVTDEDKDEVLVRANGVPTYFAADIAYHYNKFAVRGFSRAIDVWGADHHGHVARMKGAMDAIGLDGEKLDIVLMQFVRLMQDGQPVRMSKRTGKAIGLAELLDEVPIDSARFQFNLREPGSVMDFDMDLAVAQDSENPVYYVQYAHARICSILKKLAEDGIVFEGADKADLTLLTEPAEKELIRHIADFPGEIISAAKSYDPARITRYVTELANRYHKFYNSCRVKDAEHCVCQARIALCTATKNVISNALTLLKITVPESM